MGKHEAPSDASVSEGSDQFEKLSSNSTNIYIPLTEDNQPSTIIPPGISRALRAVSDTQGDLIKAKARVIDEARMWLLTADSQEELLARAALVYWRVRDVPAAMLAEIVLGNPNFKYHLLKLLPSVFITACSRRHRRTVHSRAELAEIENGSKLCPECRDSDLEDNRRINAIRKAESVRRLEELRSMPYADYLQTEEWRERRHAALRRAGYKCQACNKAGSLDVHHRTYERRGCEEIGDLTVLCRACHGKFHGKPLPAHHSG